MHPLHTAARFTAFVCYLNVDTGRLCSPKEAGRLARQNWKHFLPFVDPDVARSLTAVPRTPDRRLSHSVLAENRPTSRLAI
jgi:hypothetical protein